MASPLRGLLRPWSSPPQSTPCLVGRCSPILYSSFFHLTPSKPSLLQTMQHNSPAMCFYKTKARKGSVSSGRLATKSSLWLPAHPATQRPLGTELTNAGLHPILGEYLWEEEHTQGNASTILLPFAITYSFD